VPWTVTPPREQLLGRLIEDACADTGSWGHWLTALDQARRLQDTKRQILVRGEDPGVSGAAWGVSEARGC